MASRSIYMCDPASYGFTAILDTLPDPEVHEHRLDLTPEQRAHADGLLVETGRGLFDERMGVRERAKLARGFLYAPDGPVAVDSHKPLRVAELAEQERAAGRATLVWCNFDDEAAIIRGLLDGVPGVAALHGDTPTGERQAIIDGFRHGGVDILITKAQLVGHGLNFQRCRAMVFSGIADSFERFYVAVQERRRAVGFELKESHHALSRRNMQRTVAGGGPANQMNLLGEAA